ncbi:hypothetical protein [Gynuella sp.]|uniref:hypothetical protein n=1 Tax=Gynuella sp. TaxID=2969146 RepID=UPI003D138C6D
MMLFHYQKTRRRKALTIAIILLLMPVFIWSFGYLAENQSQFLEMYLVTKHVLEAIALILLGGFVWLMISPAKFEIYVTDSEFYCHHPLFREWCFSVHPREINRIEHNLGYGDEPTATIVMVLNNNQRYQVCMTYGYSRKQLYEALKSANPHIRLPENINLFSH